jgi:predicted Zn-dependent protease
MMDALKRKRMSLMPAVALAALGAVVAIPALSSSRLYAAGPERFTTVTIRAGDTLWSLADRRTPGGGDVEQTIDTIVAINHLDGASIVPGEHIKIPR